MKLSIFPEASSHPKDKWEKTQSAKKSIIAEIVEAESEEKLYEIITTYAWSAAIFKNNYRKSENFISEDLIALDIDSTMRMEEAEEICKSLNLCALIAPSVSSTEENHRFRIIFPLETTIKSEETHLETWKWLSEHFDCDPSCKDTSRFYFASKPENSTFIEGNLLSPIDSPIIKHDYLSKTVSEEEIENKSVLEILYGKIPNKIPEPIAYFINNAETGIPGNWNNCLNSATFTLTLQGIDDNLILKGLAKAAPNELDRRDLLTIKHAIKRAKRFREC